MHTEAHSLPDLVQRLAVLMDQAGSTIDEIRSLRDAARREAEERQAREQAAREEAQRQAELRAAQLDADHDAALLEYQARLPPPAEPKKKIVKHFSEAALASFRLKGRLMGLTSRLTPAGIKAAFAFAKQHGYEAAIARYSKAAAPPPPPPRVLRATRPAPAPPRLGKKHR